MSWRIAFVSACSMIFITGCQMLPNLMSYDVESDHPFMWSEEDLKGKDLGFSEFYSELMISESVYTRTKPIFMDDGDVPGQVFYRYERPMNLYEPWESPYRAQKSLMKAIVNSIDVFCHVNNGSFRQDGYTRDRERISGESSTNPYLIIASCELPGSDAKHQIATISGEVNNEIVKILYSEDGFEDKNLWSDAYTSEERTRKIIDMLKR